MSFSSDAKQELCQLRADKRPAALAEAYGVLLYCNTFSAREVRITWDPDLLARLSRKLTEAGLNCTSSVSTNIEIMSAQAGKGFAVEWLAEHIGATREQTMAFGDNTNDIQMLEAVGWPVAVGNAVPELKAAARLIAPDCDQDGVARTIACIAFGREDSL